MRVTARMLRIAVITLAFVLVSQAAFATPGQDLDRGREAYRNRDWDSAYKTLNTLLYPNIELARREDIWEAYVLLGGAAYHLGNRERAVSEFQKALNIELDREITTNSHTPDVVQLFDDTKARVKAEIELDQKKREAEELRRRAQEYINTIGVYEKNSYGVNFVPFGAGQFQNKQNTKGYIFAGGMLATGGVSLGAFLYLALKYGLSAKVPITEVNRVNTIEGIELYSGGAFFVFYAVSVIDAMRNYKGSRLIKGDDSLLPPDLLPQPSSQPKAAPKSPPKKTSLRDRLHIGPIPMPSGVGLGLGLEN